MSWLIPLIPALISGLSAAGSQFGKKGEEFQKLPTMNEGQQGFQKMLLDLLSGKEGQQGGPLGYLQELLSGSPESSAAFKAPIKRQFNEEIVPGLAEQFAGMGAGAQSSSGFQQALGSAGAGLSEKLASLRGGLRMQGLQSMMSLLPSAMQESFAYTNKPRGGGWQDILGAFGKGVSGMGGEMTPQLAKKYWGMG